MYNYVSIYMYNLCIYLSTSVHVHVCIFIYMYIIMYMFLSFYMYLYVSLSTCISIHTVCTCTVSVYMFIVFISLFLSPSLQDLRELNHIVGSTGHGARIGARRQLDALLSRSSNDASIPGPQRPCIEVSNNTQAVMKSI